MQKWQKFKLPIILSLFRQESPPRLENCTLTGCAMFQGPKSLILLALSSLLGTNIALYRALRLYLGLIVTKTPQTSKKFILEIFFSGHPISEAALRIFRFITGILSEFRERKLKLGVRFWRFCNFAKKGKIPIAVIGLLRRNLAEQVNKFPEHWKKIY